MNKTKPNKTTQQTAETMKKTIINNNKISNNYNDNDNTNRNQMSERERESYINQSKFDNVCHTPIYTHTIHTHLFPNNNNNKQIEISLTL